MPPAAAGGLITVSPFPGSARPRTEPPTRRNLRPCGTTALTEPRPRRKGPPAEPRPWRNRGPRDPAGRSYGPAKPGPGRNPGLRGVTAPGAREPRAATDTSSRFLDSRWVRRGRFGGRRRRPCYFLFRRWTRVFRNSLRCFFFAILLRRFFMTEPTGSPLPDALWHHLACLRRPDAVRQGTRQRLGYRPCSPRPSPGAPRCLTLMGSAPAAPLSWPRRTS